MFVRAGELSSAESYSNIGYAFDFGNGVDIDKKKSNHYYKLAAIAGGVTSRYNLGNNEQRAGNIRRALKHYMIAAGGCDSDSLKQIQKLYSNGYQRR